MGVTDTVAVAGIVGAGVELCAHTSDTDVMDKNKKRVIANINFKEDSVRLINHSFVIIVDF